jgi:hypothetical protein
MSIELFGLLVIIALGVVIFGLVGVGAFLVIRDTIRQRGVWGINLKPAVCTQCGTTMPTVRKPANWRQALWGGGTCPECGFELDKWGRPVEDQNTLAKWNVLRAAKETERGEHGLRHRDARIRDANDQTQRGDAP